VSFGVVPIEDGRARLDGARYRVVRPEVTVSARSVAVHGIRPVDLEEAPPLSDVVDELRGALLGRAPVAWASWVEATFLARAMGGGPRRWGRRIVDVARLVPWLDELEGRAAKVRETLEEAVARFGLPLEQAHHALGDAIMTAELFLAVASRLEALGRGDLRSLLRPPRPTRA
jgi:DNA polymerase-3 subunit epsilon